MGKNSVDPLERVKVLFIAQIQSLVNQPPGCNRRRFGNHSGKPLQGTKARRASIGSMKNLLFWTSQDRFLV